MLYLPPCPSNARVLVGIGSPSRPARRPAGKARGGRIPGVFDRRVTPPGRGPRRARLRGGVERGCIGGQDGEVIPTRGLRRGTPYATTAWAPKTYQRPHRARTGARVVSSSSGAGWTGAAETLGQARVGGHILPSACLVWPGGVAQQRLATKFLGHAEAFGRTQATDACSPVRVLAGPHRPPVPGNELANPARDHTGIVARPCRSTPAAGLLAPVVSHASFSGAADPHVRLARRLTTVARVAGGHCLSCNRLTSVTSQGQPCTVRKRAATESHSGGVRFASRRADGTIRCSVAIDPIPHIGRAG